MATRLEPFVEALGSQASFVEPGAEPAALTRALAVELERGRDPGLRAARRAHAAAFTWERHARATLEVWRDVLGR